MNKCYIGQIKGLFFRIVQCCDLLGSEIMLKNVEIIHTYPDPYLAREKKGNKMSWTLACIIGACRTRGYSHMSPQRSQNTLEMQCPERYGGPCMTRTCHGQSPNFVSRPPTMRAGPMRPSGMGRTPHSKRKRQVAVNTMDFGKRFIRIDITFLIVPFRCSSCSCHSC